MPRIELERVEAGRGARARARPRASTASRSPSARSRSSGRPERRSRSARARAACASKPDGSGAAPDGERWAMLSRARATRRGARSPQRVLDARATAPAPRTVGARRPHRRGSSTSCSTSARRVSGEPHYITRAGRAAAAGGARRAPRRSQRPKVVQDVADAAAQGDRSENAEYIYGKKKLREIDRRIHFLTKRLETRTRRRADATARGSASASSSARPSSIEDEDGKTSTLHDRRPGRDSTPRAGASATSRRSRARS